MSENLNEFALKLASALDSYAEQGAKSLTPKGTPFHYSMLKMAQALKRRKAGHDKRAFVTGAIGAVAPGILAALGGRHMWKRMAPAMQDMAMSSVKPADLLARGVAGVTSKAGPNAGDAGRALVDALGGTLPGQEASRILQDLGSSQGIRPWQVGAAGLGGAAAMGILNRNQGSSGPPMIIA